MLPFDLERVYGGIGFPTQILYSNFVTSIDGVATLGEGHHAGSHISGKYPADRMLMGLLRACADAVMIGAGTLRSTPGHVWTAAHVFPQLAESFAGLRRSLDRSPEPRLVVLTASGDIDTDHVAIRRGATILTTASGAKALEGKLPAGCDVVPQGPDQRIEMGQAMDELRSRGHAVVLTEGGPHLLGGLIERSLLDELFITTSPVILGRFTPDRLGMVDGVEFMPPQGPWFRLLSVRRHADYLFLRYGLRRRQGISGPG